jgi:hypothetical protein
MGGVAAREGDDDSFVDLLVPFQMAYEDGVERLAAESLLERQKWVNRIWWVSLLFILLYDMELARLRFSGKRFTAPLGSPTRRARLRALRPPPARTTRTRARAAGREAYGVRGACGVTGAGARCSCRRWGSWRALRVRVARVRGGARRGASEWARTGTFTPATSRACTAMGTGTGTGRLDFVGLVYSYVALINGFHSENTGFDNVEVDSPSRYKYKCNTLVLHFFLNYLLNVFATDTRLDWRILQPPWLDSRRYTMLITLLRERTKFCCNRTKQR